MFKSIVLVSKRDGTTRFCVHYRKLNAITKSDVFPLPRIDSYLDSLEGNTYFSTLDLMSGYWQVAMEEESKEKTSFVTHEGSYQFNVMPFGLKNAPSTFQRLMNTVFAELMPKKCLVYIDDLLVLGKSFDEHLSNLRLVFEKLRSYTLKVKPAKCSLAERKVKYLGYVISEHGIEPDHEKVQAVVHFLKPTNVKALRSFLGLTSYYRRFIPSYSKIAQALHQLTKKDVPFVWSELAVNVLKQRLVDAPILRFPNLEKPFILDLKLMLQRSEYWLKNGRWESSPNRIC